MNEMINNFIEHKKLKLSEQKCFRIHIGEGHTNCPELKVHNHKMKSAEKEKYLGDIIDRSGKIQATIDSRKSKGQGIVANISSIINEIPFGKHRVEVGLRLREAMLLNGMLFNSEVWHGVTNAQIASLEAVDQTLLRGILNAKKGTPNHFLYLETGTLPIHWVLAQRRINFLRHLYSRNDEELIKKVFKAQKDKPTAGDFVKLVQKDLTKVGIKEEDIEQGSISKAQLRKIVRDVAFSQLRVIQSKGTKAKNIVYNTLQMQHYLGSDNISHEEMATMTNLRARCIKGIRSNFKKMYKACLHCPLQCNTESPLEDTQEHVLTCGKLGGSTQDMVFMFASSVEQGALAREFLRLMNKRNTLGGSA